MQNQISPVPNNEIKEGGKQLEDILRALPQELLGVIPESVWINLSLDQKKEILRQHNIFEKYTAAEQPQAEVENTVTTEIEEKKPDVIVEQANQPEQIRTPEFAKALEEAKEIENNAQNELPVEETQRVEDETASAQNTAKSSWGAKVFGYTVSEDTASKSEELSLKGDPEDGKTWAATILRRILAMLGQ